MEIKASALLLLVLVVNLIVTHDDGVSAADSAPQCTPITAAVKPGGILFFIYGSWYSIFDANSRHLLQTGLVRFYFKKLPPSFRVEAAFIPSKFPNTIILVSGDKYISYSIDGRLKAPAKPLTDIFPRSKNFAQGIDAAVTYNQDEYFFKGCALVVRWKGHRDRIYNLEKLHLPCNVDAAWVNRGKIVISKGKFAWLMQKMKRLNPKPLCFANSFRLGANICKCSNTAS